MLKSAIFIIILVSFLNSCTPWERARNKNIFSETLNNSNYFNQIKINGVYYIYHGLNKYSNKLFLWENGLIFRGNANKYDSLTFFNKNNLIIREEEKLDPSKWGCYKIIGNQIFAYFTDPSFLSKYQEIKYIINYDQSICICSYFNGSFGDCTFNFKFKELDWKPDSIDLIKGYIPNYMNK